MGNNDLMMNEKIEARFNWDAYPRQRAGGMIAGLMSKPITIDCDACAVFCDEKGNPISREQEKTCLSYRNGSLFESAATHSGDNTTGEGLDDEVISLDLPSLPSEVSMIILTMDLFKEKKEIGAGKIQNTFLRIVRTRDDTELDRCDFSSLGTDNQLVVCGILRRKGTGWTFAPVKEAFSVEDMNTFIAG